jgi:hypothetical protein
MFFSTITTTLHLSLKLKKVYIEYISFFPEEQKNESFGEGYPGHLTKAIKCLGGWTVSTVKGRGGSILPPKSGAVPATTTVRRRRYATGAAGKAGR